MPKSSATAAHPEGTWIADAVSSITAGPFTHVPFAILLLRYFVRVPPDEIGET